MHFCNMRSRILHPRDQLVAIMNRIYRNGMTTASSILKAFDRLEVAEFSARSLLDTALIGSHVPIGETEIADLKRAFKLAEED